MWVWGLSAAQVCVRLWRWGVSASRARQEESPLQLFPFQCPAGGCMVTLRGAAVWNHGDGLAGEECIYAACNKYPNCLKETSEMSRPVFRNTGSVLNQESARVLPGIKQLRFLSRLSLRPACALGQLLWPGQGQPAACLSLGWEVRLRAAQARSAGLCGLRIGTDKGACRGLWAWKPRYSMQGRPASSVQAPVIRVCAGRQWSLDGSRGAGCQGETQEPEHIPRVRSEKVSYRERHLGPQWEQKLRGQPSRQQPGLRGVQGSQGQRRVMGDGCRSEQMAARGSRNSGRSGRWPVSEPEPVLDLIDALSGAASSPGSKARWP